MVKKSILFLLLSVIILIPLKAISQPLFSPAGVEIPLEDLTSAAAADFNEDGQPDIVALRDDAYVIDLFVLLMQPSGWYATIEIMDIDGYSVWAADFNDDGFNDILINDSDHLRVYLFFGDGTGSFSNPDTLDVTLWGISGTARLGDIADFDGRDGYDLIYGDETGSKVVMNNGDGTFFVSELGYPNYLEFEGFAAAGDFNNDGSDDIVLPAIINDTTSDPDSVAVFLNNGTGIFTLSGTFAVGRFPTDIDVGDFDNDGNLDIVSAIYEPSVEYPVISLLKGRGDGTFDSNTGITYGESTIILHPVDINADGNLDLFVTDEFLGSNLGVLLGDGLGGFQNPDWIATPGIISFNCSDDLFSIDINGDNHQDILYPRSSGLVIFYNDENGTVQTAQQYEVDSNPYSAVTADFNNDLYDDLAVSCGPGNSVMVLLNDGSGQLDGSSANYALSGMPKTIRAADLNNDNASDLIIADSTNISIVTLLGNGSGGFGSPQSFQIDGDSIVIDFQAADFDEDGNVDVAAITSRVLTVLLGDGSGSFSDTLVHNFGVVTGIEEIHLADFNEDNHIDLALLTYGPKITLLSGSGDGRFGNQQDYSIYSFNTKIIVADINKDNHQDVVTGGGGSAQVWLGDGTGDLNSGGFFSPDLDFFHGMIIGDYNGDSNPDVLFNDFTLKVYSGDGAGNFTPDHWRYPDPGRYNYITTGIPTAYDYIYNNDNLFSGDFNHDGSADLVLIHPDTNIVSVMMGGFETYTHDVGVLSILEPSGSILTDTTIYPRAIIANFGAGSESFQAYFHIGSVYSDTIDVTLDIGQVDTIGFDTWIPTEADDYQIECGVILTGDENQSNNTKTGSVTVIDISGSIPIITDIHRDYGGDIGWITTQITGYNFETGASIKLIRQGEPDIAAGSYQVEITEVIDSLHIRAVFNLTNVERGNWDLVVANPGGEADTLVDGFTVEIGNRHLWLDVGGLSEIRLTPEGDIPLTYSIYAGNSGNNNLDRIILEIDIANYIKVITLSNPETNEIFLYGDSLYDNGITEPYLPFYISTIRPGETKVYQLDVETVWDNYNGKIAEPVMPLMPDGIDVKGGAMDALTCFGKSLYNSGVENGGLSEQDFRDAGAEALEGFAEGLVIDGIKITIQILFPWTIPFIQAYDLATGLMGALESAGQIADMAATFFGIVFGFFHDPNDKAGPNGWGDEGYINDNRLYQYTIYFENDSTATLSVPIVEVYDTLDIDLDWSTLEFGDSKHTLTSMDVDTSGSYGIIKFIFENINLPPNVNPPEGQSWFTYTIWPDSGLPSGTEITNRAAIVFTDGVVPETTIYTRTVLNTIDNEPPQSSINQLPATMNSVAFRLSWSGSDNESGIFRYDIFCSKDGGEYDLWQNTADTTTVFIGKNGSTYGFYSTAIDNVGYTEARPDEPDVIITIDADEDIGVNPNPFAPSRGHSVITFFGGSVANSTIKIYNKAGRLVRTLYETSGESTLEWDAANDDGEKLASGVYIWFLDGPAGKDKGKFAIIR